MCLHCKKSADWLSSDANHMLHTALWPKTVYFLNIVNYYVLMYNQCAHTNIHIHLCASMLAKF